MGQPLFKQLSAGNLGEEFKVTASTKQPPMKVTQNVSSDCPFRSRSSGYVPMAVVLKGNSKRCSTMFNNVGFTMVKPLSFYTGFYNNGVMMPLQQGRLLQQWWVSHDFNMAWPCPASNETTRDASSFPSGQQKLVGSGNIWAFIPGEGVLCSDHMPWLKHHRAG